MTINSNTIKKKKSNMSKLGLKNRKDTVGHKSKTKFRFPVIAVKTLKDISKWWVTLIFLALALFVPFILATMVLPDMKLMNYPIEMQLLQLRDYLLFSAYFMICGLILALFTAVFVSGFISTEVSSGTLLTLVSKPVRRWEILLGKFLAYFIYITILEIISLLIAVYIFITFSGCSLSLFIPLAGFIPIILIYGLFVALIFGLMTLTFSTICKNRSSALMIMVGVILLIYLVFFILRTIGSGFYVDYQLYHIDLGYHLGNVFTLFLQLNNIDLTPMTQMMISMFSGTYDISSTANLFEPDQGFILPTLKLSGYYDLWHSFFLYIFMAIGFILLAHFNLKRKEVG